MKKKLLALTTALTLTLALAACGAKPAAPAAPADTADTAQPFHIGIIQLTEHVSLDAACKGFLEGLTEAGLVEGTDYVIDMNNAQGEQALCGTIATKLVNDKVDLILAIATPAAQAAANATTEIPILVTAVTDPAASGLVDSNENPGRNVSGTSDMNPVADQIDLLLQLKPDAKNIGVMYCSSEDNSALQVKVAKDALEAKGLTVTEFTAADSSEIQSVAQSAVGVVDAMYMPTDNLMADTITAISSILTPAGIPIVPGASGMCDDGGTATYGIDYEQLGRQTATQAVELLKNKADIKTMPIQFYAGDLPLTVNQANLDAMGITLPADLKK
ncbi:MAG: ABC transporter substrate-binding protein [Oscillospiraceae bacterium]